MEISLPVRSSCPFLQNKIHDLQSYQASWTDDLQGPRQDLHLNFIPYS